MAKYLASRLQLSCYLEDGIWNETEESKSRRDRLVVCLDSIYKLKKSDYDVILLDEGAFVQYHFVSGTIKTGLSSILSQFKFLLQNRSKIIVMQQCLPETTIDFYCNLVGCESSNRNAVSKRKFEKPTVLQPLHQWSCPQEMIANMVRDYIENFNVEDGRSNSPFIVFCSRVDFSLMLYQLLCEVANDALPEEARTTGVNRIKGVWAQVQNNQWDTRFLRDPNAYALDCDVLIVTSVLQAGHSLDTHFTTSYDVLFNNVLSFREELQFVSRLRYLDRSDVRQFKHAWIEKAISNLNIASMNRITASLETLMSEESASAHIGTITSIIAAINSERADTSNRHDYLWNQEYKLSTVNKITIGYNDDEHIF